ncbi:MAG TPA: PIG-L family deacetylase [Gaiellaceae bacterium]|nr:PIG-L family deacetylase [Gaiellaceae bacterium]
MAARLATRASGACRWLLGRGDELEGRVVVVSVHLDDAIFSVGAALARAARRGADVIVLTVLANDPESDAPAGEWDARAGFESAGQAARARREEDRRACAAVGARPVWLPFGDEMYGLGAEPEAVAAAVVDAVAGADVVLLPGFPLLHDDHALVAGLLGGRIDTTRVGEFVEQPYAMLQAAGPDGCGWRPLAASPRDRLAKLRGFRAYASQLPLLGDHVVRATTRWEALRGGEAVRWITRG